MAFSLTCGAWASASLRCSPARRGLPQRLGFGKLMEQQAKGRSTTKKGVNVNVLTHPCALAESEEIEVAMPAATRAHLTNLANEACMLCLWHAVLCQP